MACRKVHAADPKNFLGGIIFCYVGRWVRVELCVGNAWDEFIPGIGKLEEHGSWGLYSLKVRLVKSAK